MGPTRIAFAALCTGSLHRLRGHWLACFTRSYSMSRLCTQQFEEDMAVVTWPMERGMRDASCLRCVFDLAGAIKDRAATWEARFGQVPEFRAVLHCGSVVTAEIGLERHKIAYFGDVVNTTGSLESLSKTLGERVLVSADLLEGIGSLPEHLIAENLGFHVMRGREEPLQISAIRLRPDCPEMARV